MANTSKVKKNDKVKKEVKPKKQDISDIVSEALTKANEELKNEIVEDVIEPEELTDNSEVELVDVVVNNVEESEDIINIDATAIVNNPVSEIDVQVTIEDDGKEEIATETLNDNEVVNNPIIPNSDDMFVPSENKNDNSVEITPKNVGYYWNGQFKDVFGF